MTANLNRDQKKRKKPYVLSDFTFFAALEEQALAPAAAGAAMLQLIRDREFPSFALFIYQQLREAGQGAAVPKRIALRGENCIVLAPYRKSQTQWAGLLICEAPAMGHIQDFRDDAGAIWRLRVPVIGDAGGVLAAEDSQLPIVEAPSALSSDALQLQQSSENIQDSPVFPAIEFEPETGVSSYAGRK